MGIVKTSVFQLEAPDDLEPLNNWAGIARRNSAVMDAAMAQRVTPPGIADLNAEVAARQAADTALAAADTALAGRATVLEYDSGNLFPTMAAGFTTLGSTDARRLTVRRVGKLCQAAGIINRDTGSRVGKFADLPAANLKPSATISVIGTSAGQPVMELYVNVDGTMTVNSSVTAGLGCIFSVFWFAAA